MKFLIKLHHWPLRLKIALLLLVSSVFPFAIFVGIEFHDARGDEVKSKPDVFHALYQEGSKRFTNIPEAETIEREELTRGTHV